MIKNKYLDTKSNLLQRQGAELHIEVALDHVVGVVGVAGVCVHVHLVVLKPACVGLHLAFMKPVPINSA